MKHDDKFISILILTTRLFLYWTPQYQYFHSLYLSLRLSASILRWIVHYVDNDLYNLFFMDLWPNPILHLFFFEIPTYHLMVSLTKIYHQIQQPFRKTFLLSIKQQYDTFLGMEPFDFPLFVPMTKGIFECLRPMYRWELNRSYAHRKLLDKVLSS